MDRHRGRDRQGQAAVTTADRKLRRDAWWAQLSDEQQAQVRDQMRRHAWHEVSPWAAETFGIPPPGKALYGFREWFDEHESEFLLRQRLRDIQAMQRELEQVGAADAETLAAVLGNDVAAARSAGDQKALERAVRAFKTVASIVGDTRSFALKVREFEQDQKSFELRKAEFEQKLRADVENGLQALFEQVKGNPDAEALVEELQRKVAAAKTR